MTAAPSPRYHFISGLPRAGSTLLSALLRLDLYVAAYSLTSLRLAAFVWMLLGSVSGAVVQASQVPVIVARRR